MLCPYCNAAAPQVTGKEIYPHRADLHTKIFYQCSPCDAYVGCHPGSNKALGRLANAKLRRAKMRAHSAFDAIWKDGNKTRTQAYQWLAHELSISVSECHIGMFDVEMCEEVVELATEYLLTN